MITKRPQVLATTRFINHTVIKASVFPSWILTCIIHIILPVTVCNCMVSKFNFIKNLNLITISTIGPFDNCTQKSSSNCKGFCHRHGIVCFYWQTVMSLYPYLLVLRLIHKYELTFICRSSFLISR